MAARVVSTRESMRATFAPVQPRSQFPFQVLRRPLALGEHQHALPVGDQLLQLAAARRPFSGRAAARAASVAAWISRRKSRSATMSFASARRRTLPASNPASFFASCRDLTACASQASRLLAAGVQGVAVLLDVCRRCPVRHRTPASALGKQRRPDPVLVLGDQRASASVAEHILQARDQAHAQALQDALKGDGAALQLLERVGRRPGPPDGPRPDRSCPCPRQGRGGTAPVRKAASLMPFGAPLHQLHRRRSACRSSRLSRSPPHLPQELDAGLKPLLRQLDQVAVQRRSPGRSATSMHSGALRLGKWTTLPFASASALHGRAAALDHHALQHRFSASLACPVVHASCPAVNCPSAVVGRAFLVQLVGVPA